MSPVVRVSADGANEWCSGHRWGKQTAVKCNTEIGRMPTKLNLIEMVVEC